MTKDEEFTSPKPKKQKVEKLHGMAVEQHRRKYGDLVKAKISMEKYAIAARTCVVSDMPLDVFQALIVPNATVTPSTFDSTTEVVVALLKNAEAVGNAFGHSKIKGGNRMAQLCADRCDVIYSPPSKMVRIHWTMR